jgi:rubrerythrin
MAERNPLMIKPEIKTPLRLEYLSPSELKAHPKNWRIHGEGQLTALKDVIERVGWAGALLFNERTGRLIDGHARKEIAEGDEKVPVLIGSWDEEEEKLILATLDPLSAMAHADQGKLDALLEEIETDSAAIQAILDDLGSPEGTPTEPPDEFPEYDESIETEHKCPKCGYVWSGKAQ